MKYYLFILISLSLLYGCSASLIRIKANPDQKAYPMFGKTPGRDFYTSENIGDTLIKKWENDVNGGFNNSSVTVYGGYVFVGDLSGRIFCFNDTTGKVMGKLKYKGAVFSAPVIDKTNVIFAVVSENSNESNLISYNFVTGKENYDKEIKGKILTEIIKIDTSIVFNSEDGKVFRYSIKGEKIWELETGSFTHSSPAMEDNTIVFGNDKGELLAVSYDDGKLLYRKKIGDPFFCGAAIRDGIAFIGNDNGKLYAVEIKSGDIKWKFDTHARIKMTPALKDNIIIVGNLNGDLFAINRSTGKQIWVNKTGGLFDAAPLITENTIVQPDLNEKFYLIDPLTGKIMNTYPLDGRVKLTPVIADSTLFIGYENGYICAYEF
ncbi:MAG: PQQ-binding-like beta-propeller repeat protein [Ignavibacteriaceae bacterium]